MTRVAPARPVKGLSPWASSRPPYCCWSAPVSRPSPGWLPSRFAAAIVLGRTPGDKLWAASGFLYGLVIVLVPPLVRAHPNLGLVGLLWMFAVVWATDIAGYFTGRTFGGPKLWPRVSPKKTWSGFHRRRDCRGDRRLSGGVDCAARTVGCRRSACATPSCCPSSPRSLARLGDLGESALKRHCDVKDSSQLIPGHGGVMDRLDGFWAVSLILGIVLFLTWLAG